MPKEWGDNGHEGQEKRHQDAEHYALPLKHMLAVLQGLDIRANRFEQEVHLGPTALKL